MLVGADPIVDRTIAVQKFDNCDQGYLIWSLYQCLFKTITTDVGYPYTLETPSNLIPTLSFVTPKWH